MEVNVMEASLWKRVHFCLKDTEDKKDTEDMKDTEDKKDTVDKKDTEEKKDLSTSRWRKWQAGGIDHQMSSACFY